MEAAKRDAETSGKSPEELAGVVTKIYADAKQDLPPEELSKLLQSPAYKDADANGRDTSGEAKELAKAMLRRMNRFTWKSEQMDAANIPATEEAAGAPQLQAPEGWKELSKKDFAPIKGIDAILDLSEGVAPAAGPHSERMVRPMSAVDACWCQGSIKQPRGFDCASAADRTRDTLHEPRALPAPCRSRR